MYTAYLLDTRTLHMLLKDASSDGNLSIH